MERTLAILKPDCLRNGHVGKVINAIEADGYAILAMRMTTLTRGQAEAFYAVHRGKFFYDGLVEYMSSGPCIAMILEREGAILGWRRLLEGLRERYGTDATQNLVHGSDAPETSAFECAFLFAGCETV